VRLGFNLAGEDGLLSDNPASGMNIPVPERTPRLFTEFEIHKMLTQFNPEMRDFVAILYYQAFRVGEAAHLRWSDVDFDADRIAISGRDEGDNLKAWEVKTKAGTRSVPMRLEVKKMLLRRFSDRKNGSPYVFWKLQLCAHPERQAQRKFRKECNRVGILAVGGKDPSLRILRRTQITELARELVPFELQTFAGHESPHTTSKYYVHLRCEDLGKKLARVNRSHL